jgi:hypothetical protein
MTYVCAGIRLEEGVNCMCLTSKRYGRFFIELIQFYNIGPGRKFNQYYHGIIDREKSDRNKYIIVES